MTKARRLKRRTVYRSPWVNLHIDRVRMPGGHIIDEFHFLDHETQAVGVLVEDARGRLLFEKVYRYTTGAFNWEIPAGGIDPGESVLESARREVHEETGYELTRLRRLYTYHPTNGSSNKVFHVVHARAGQQTGKIDPHEVHALRWLSLAQIRRMIDREEIRDGLSLIALLFHEFRGRKSGKEV
jgi:ADP-ribose pyrophosphatase